MGFEARYQAIPEDDFLQRARTDAGFAESIQFFNDRRWRTLGAEPWRVALRKLSADHPGLEERYFCGGNRQYDALHYLLSNYRRNPPLGGLFRDDPSSIARAIFGTEALHPTARSTQGFPIGLVPAAKVPELADYLRSIRPSELWTHYEGEGMKTASVYKNGANIQWILDELQGMRLIYEAAASRGEAMVNLLD